MANIKNKLKKTKRKKKSLQQKRKNNNKPFSKNEHKEKSILKKQRRSFRRDDDEDKGRNYKDGSGFKKRSFRRDDDENKKARDKRLRNNKKKKQKENSVEQFLKHEEENILKYITSPSSLEKKHVNPEETTSFYDLNLSEKLKKTLLNMEYYIPTPVQAKTIPAVINGKDILASSQTGTGKTGAFLIPIINILDKDANKYALIVTPTRELAKQVQTFANQMMGGHKGANSVLLIGGSDMSSQLRQLKKSPRIVIGTPGRINDHLKRKSLSLKKTHFLVLDETDRMLDMGFASQIDDIIKYVPKERQTLLFSATFPKAILELAEKYLTEPVRISIGGKNAIANKITQNIINTENKFETLIKELKNTKGSVLVFVRTRRNAEKIGKRLKEDHNYKAQSLHGDLRQNKREKVMKSFRNKRHDILVATDVASRGLDVPHIEYVINYDVPDAPEDYIHRIGRTARAEKSGIAISFISKREKRKWQSVQDFVNGKETSISAQKKSSSKKRKFKGKARGQANKNNNSTKRHH